MAGGKDGAAVLIGEDGGIVGADAAGKADDLHLVHADEGAEDRHGGDGLGDAQAQHGLACHLAQGFAGDQGLGPGLLGNGLRQAHHEAAHDEGEELLGAVLANFLLDFGEGDDVDDHAAAGGGEEPGKLDDLVLGLLGGVGRGDEVDHLQLYAAAGDHPGGDGGVQAAGEEAHSVAAGADGQSTCTGDGGCMDVGELLTDLHVNRQVRLVDIHADAGESLCQLAAHGLGDLDGVEIEVLVRPLALHLEGLGLGELPGQILLGGGDDGFHALLAGHGPGNSHYAEDLLAGLIGGIQVAAIVLGLYVDGGLAHIDVEVAAGLHAAAGVGEEPVLEGTAVQALEDHLAQL